MGYNMAITVIICSYMQIWDYDVRFKMAKQEIFVPDRTPSDHFKYPLPSNVYNHLHIELVCAQVNEQHLFYTAVITGRGPNTGNQQ